MGRINMKALFVLALVICCYAMQGVVVSQPQERREGERGGGGREIRRREREQREEEPMEEERRAEEEEWRRRERTAEEEGRRRQRRERGREEEQAEEEEQEGGGGGGGERSREEQEEFVLREEGKRVVRTEAGEMRVVRGFGGGGRRRMIAERPLHIGFITMEPRSLFIPQYVDSSLIIFVRRGQAKLGLIYKDEPGERQLRTGDVYRIPAGSAFYIVNTGEGQRLHIVCSIDPSEGLGFGPFQSFFVGGGRNPTSVLAGFDPQTLSTAFNVSADELEDIMTGQESGPIVFTDSHQHVPGRSLWSDFPNLRREERLEHLRKMMPPPASSSELHEDDDQYNYYSSSSKSSTSSSSRWYWSWKKRIMDAINQQLPAGINKKRGGRDEKASYRSKAGPDSYNLYDRSPDFKNNYGWSVALDEHDYSPLKKSGIGIYLVNLTAGSMMAPHINPTATEYGVVLYGSGTIEIVYPNGTSAMRARVSEGSVFWVPRYFPFCQIASRTGAFEFFGFTTSSRRNRPQFLAGATSILKTMRGPEFATAFGTTEDRFTEIVDAQSEAIILPSAAAAPPT